MQHDKTKLQNHQYRQPIVAGVMVLPNRLGMLRTSTKFFVASAAAVALAFLVWVANQNSTKPASSLTAPATTFKPAAPNGQISSQANSVSNAQSDPSQAASSSTGNNNTASASINGQNISVSSNSPNTSVSKTINTDNGSATVSIQTSTNKSGNGNSFQSEHVFSSSTSSSSSVNEDQQSSGGSTP